MKSHKNDTSALVPQSTSVPMQMAEVAEILGADRENFLKEAMAAAGELYADFEEKEKKMIDDVDFEEKRVRDLDGKWAQRKEELHQEDIQIVSREIQNPYQEISKLSDKMGDVRWQLLNIFFNSLDGGKSIKSIIDWIPKHNRNVKTILRAYFQQNDGELAKEFFSNYKFDTGNIDADLDQFLKRFCAVSEIREGKENVCAESSSYKYVIKLKQNLRFALADFLKAIPENRHEVRNFGQLSISDEAFLDKSGSEEWIEHLVNFLIVDLGNKGDLAERSRVDDVDGFLKILVRCTEYELVNKKKRQTELADYSQKRAEVTTKLSKDKIEEAMRDSDELKMQLPYLYDNSKGRKLGGDHDISVTGQTNIKSYYFAEVKKNSKFPSHVAAEFGKVIFQKWNEGDEKGIIKPIARSMGICEGYVANKYFEFERLKELREKQKSAFVKHLPTVAHLTNFTAKDKARLEELEKKYGGKPDEYAEKLYDLYNLAIYFHKLGETLYDKGANEAQKKAGLEKMLFAAGLTRVLETMLATLEVRLSVMEVSRGVDIPEFLQFAEALEVMARDPLSRQVERVIDESMMKFRAALETTKAE